MIGARFARLLRLDPNERRLLIEAVTLLGVISPLLKHGPGPLTGLLIRRASVAGTGATDGKLVSEVAAAVNKATPHVPSATCLARALTGWVMVSRRHEVATVRLGVNRSSAHEIAAHAWLECNGERVIGGENSREFTPFPTYS